jgi:hypothetical protein
MGEPISSPGRRRWLIAAGAALLLAVVAWQILERVADVDRYRPQVEEQLSRAVGLPVSIARLDLAWRPIPCLSAIDVAVGEGGLEATTSRVDLYPAVHALASRRVEIVRISLRELVVTLPADPGAIRSAWEEIDGHLRAAFSGGDETEASGWSVGVSRVEAQNAAIRFGTDASPRLVASVSADGIGSGPLELALAADFPEVGAHTEGSFVFPLGDREAEGGGLRGHLDVSRLQPQRLFELPALLHSTWNARIEIVSEEVDAFRIDLAGAFEPDEPGAAGGSFASQMHIDRDATAAGTLDVKSGDFSIDADARWADDALEIAKLDAGPISLRGRVRPDAERDGVDLALSGKIELADAWLQALGVPTALRDTSGTLIVEELSGHFPPEPGASPVSVRAQLAGGSLRIVTEGVEDAISDLALDVSSREKRIFVEARAHSQKSGNVSASVTLDPAAKSARGNFSIDPGTLTAYITGGAVRAILEPVLQRYGEKRVGFRLDPVAAKEDIYELSIEIAEAPRGNGVLTLHTDGISDVLGDVHAKVEVSADALVGLLPEGARATGSASFETRRSLADGTFTLDADLTNLGLATGSFVEKQPGESLALRLAGTSDWDPRRFDISSGKGALSFAFENGGLVARELDLDLADWSHLLIETAWASGRVRGSIDTGAPDARLELSEVALHFSPDVGVDAIDGAVELRGGDWSVRDLRIRGAQSDATLSAALSKGTLEGQLTGANLDLDFVRALIDEVNALRSDAENEEARRPISGTLAIRFDRIGYGRSEAKAVVADVAMRDGNIAVRDFALDTYEGHVSGSIDVRAREYAPSLLALDLAFADVTGRFLDDVFFDPPRELRGRFAGTLRFEAPLHEDTKAMLADASGTLDAKGVEGSFGKLGIATEIVTAVRSTEALRAKLPSMQYEGLVFDTTQAKLAMKQGRLGIELFDIDSHSYTIDATGELDFREEKSKVPIEANVIKGLAGVVSWIPGPGRALEIVSIRLVATGSPYDLKVGVASFTDQILGAGRAGAGAIIKDASGAMNLLRGAVGGTNAPASPEPDARASGTEPAAPDPARETPAAEPPTAADSEAAPGPESRNHADAPASEVPPPQPAGPDGGSDATERPPGEAL